MLPVASQIRGRRGFEVFFAQQPPQPTPRPEGAEAFDEMYDDGDDPWGWETSWYETRRLSLVMGLPAAGALRPGAGAGLRH